MKKEKNFQFTKAKAKLFCNHLKPNSQTHKVRDGQTELKTLIMLLKRL